jgi:hypothetical protein
MICAVITVTLSVAEMAAGGGDESEVKPIGRRYDLSVVS